MRPLWSLHGAERDHGWPWLALCFSPKVIPHDGRRTELLNMNDGMGNSSVYQHRLFEKSEKKRWVSDLLPIQIVIFRPFPHELPINPNSDGQFNSPAGTETLLDQRSTSARVPLSSGRDFKPDTRTTWEHKHCCLIGPIMTHPIWIWHESQGEWNGTWGTSTWNSPTKLEDINENGSNWLILLFH